MADVQTVASSRSGARKSPALPRPTRSIAAVAVAERQPAQPVDGLAFQRVEAHGREYGQVIEPAVAILIRGQEEGVLVAGAR